MLVYSNVSIECYGMEGCLLWIVCMLMLMCIDERIGELYYIVYRSWGLEAGDAAQPWHSWQLRHGRDTDRAEVGTAESSRAQPRHPHHPPHTPTPGTLSIYTFRWLLLRCIFIALAKVNKCNQQENLSHSCLSHSKKGSFVEFSLLNFLIKLVKSKKSLLLDNCTWRSILNSALIIYRQ